MAMYPSNVWTNGGLHGSQQQNNQSNNYLGQQYGGIYNPITQSHNHNFYELHVKDLLILRTMDSEVVTGLQKHYKNHGVEADVIVYTISSLQGLAQQQMAYNQFAAQQQGTYNQSQQQLQAQQQLTNAAGITNIFQGKK